MRRAPLLAAGLVGVFVLSSCGGSDDGAADGTPEPEPTASVTAEDLTAWVADADWSIADHGVGEPYTVTLAEGTATDDHLRSYELGVAVEGDADGDGVVDIAVPITRLDGNAVMELWYLWLGVEDGDAPARQVIYPIARTTGCGDTVHAVTALDEGFQVDHTLRLPQDTTDCASGGTGHQVREITVAEIDGEPFPLQTSPLAAWGGICPRSEWLDGVESPGAELRAAPPASATVVTDPSEMTFGYELPEAPLMTAGGQRFVGFQPDDLSFLGPESTNADRMHCAFVG